METQIKNILSKFYDVGTVERKLKIHTAESKNGFTLARLIRLYGLEEAERRFAIRVEQDRRKNTLAGYIDRYGPELGPEKYYEKNKKLSVSVDALTRSGKTLEEIAAIKEKHRRRSSTTLENLIGRHGVDRGTLKYQIWYNSRFDRTVRRPEYWMAIKGLSLTNALDAVANVQRRDRDYFLAAGWTEDEYADYIVRKTKGFSLAGYIERFGSDLGPKIFKNDKKKATSLEFYIKKHGDVEGNRRYYDVIQKKCFSNRRNSLGQLELANELYTRLPEDLKTTFYGDPITRPFFIGLPKNELGLKGCIPDIRIKNIVVEYDGDYWHSRPEVKIADAVKEQLLEKKGITVYRILESDFKLQKEAVVDELVEFILTHVDDKFTLMESSNEN